ncbi:MAG: haloacid dehalogenase-like hydrolase [Firmicutes bacterium]|nr:haloacid dehalogenase-like hydrolase [Bacillota bacterium]
MKLAIFDYDGTLITIDTLPCLGREWKRQGRSRRRYLAAYVKVMPFFVLYKTRLISRERMKEKALAYYHVMYRGMSAEECDAFFNQAWPMMKPHFVPRMLEEIRKAKDEGFHTVLLSGAYAGLLRIIGGDLGMDTVIGAEMPFREGAVDHRRPVPFIDGRVKLALLKDRFAGETVDWSASRSYADSFSDLPVLEAVGEPAAVNPDPMLLNHASSRGWRVIKESSQ